MVALPVFTVIQSPTIITPGFLMTHRSAKLLVTLIIFIVLTIQPASAHHTHSPTTLCKLLRPHPTDYLYLARTSLRTPSGHPLRATCFMNHPGTGVGWDHCYTGSYYYHSWIPNDPKHCP